MLQKCSPVPIPEFNVISLEWGLKNCHLISTPCDQISETPILPNILIFHMMY